MTAVPSRIGALGATLAMVFGVISCTNLVGIGGDYEDIATTYCACTGADSVFNGACASHVRNSLSRNPDAAGAWLKAYADEKCDQCDDPTSGAPGKGPWLLCAAVKPVCYALGQECSSPQTCCGYAEGHASCISSICTSCAGDSQPCTVSSDCCAGAYCGKHGSSTGTCVRELPTCHHTGGLCTTSQDCCGYEDGANANTDVTCDSTHTCVERCQLSAPDNCPGCCLSAIIDGTTATGLCGDGSTECTHHCDPGVQGSCKQLLTCTCQPFSVTQVNACTYTCAVN